MANEKNAVTSEQPNGAHLVGSVPLRDAEEVFRSASVTLGDRLRRIPDGETGVRSNWIGWQIEFLGRSPQVEVIPPDPNAYAPLPSAKLKPGVSPDAISFENLGYADAALASYQVFSRLKREGVIPSRLRFQVSLPTPIATVSAFFSTKDQPLAEPAYEHAMLRELDRILDAIPHDELAIQWDVAVEFGILEGAFPSDISGRADAMDQLVARLVRLGNRVPPDVQLGYHLCYGDAGHKHFKEPEDTSKLVAVANAVSAGLTRPLNWMHMPVPRDRADDAYFAPLRDLKLHQETELYLGLVHIHDGAEGARGRIAAAQRAVAKFGVATECGMGRRPSETIPDLLRLHSAVACPVE
jgi:hypothetical protein